MEPWHFSHGETVEELRGTMHEAASMEPWHFSHGESYPRHVGGSLQQALQWSHGILAMESQVNQFHHLPPGAASMEPWHFSHGEPAPREAEEGVLHASMEPWHFSHGEPGAA